VTSRVIPLQVSGVELLVETAPVVEVGSEPTSAKLGRAREVVTDAFDQAQNAILTVAESTADIISQLGKRSLSPNELEVKFGLKFSAQGNVIVAGAAGEATLEVTLTYRRDSIRTADEGD
jgi:hypothetical protein